MEAAQPIEGKPNEALLQHVSRVGIVIDASGSMNGKQEEVRSGFNEQLEAIQSAPDNIETYVTVVEFSTDFRVVCENIPAESVERMTEDDYHPNGMTALFDAIGKTMNIMEKSSKEGDSFLLVLITDGYENASVEYKKDSLGALVREKQDKGGWTITCMVANVDVNELISAIGLHTNNAAMYVGNAAGTRKAFGGMSAGTMSYMSNMSQSEALGFDTDAFYPLGKKKDDDSENDA